MRSKTRFRSVSLKADLVGQVEDFIKSSGRYRSIAEFVAEAARLRLETLEKRASHE